jgi:hypothetical protein
MISDYQVSRVGVNGAFEVLGSHVSGGVSLTYAPPQDRRGWASVEPHGALTFCGERWSVDGQLGLRLRSADVADGTRTRTVRQLQLQTEIEVGIGERWRAALEALGSFYDVDLRAKRLSRANAGLLVTVGDRPEDWAAGLRVDFAAHRRLRVVLGAMAVGYAVGDGGAAVPRLQLHAGPWGGFTVSPSLELVVAVADARADPVRPIAGLTLAYEHGGANHAR